MAEIEIDFMNRQTLWKPFSDMVSFKKQVRDWIVRRNANTQKLTGSSKQIQGSNDRSGCWMQI